MLRRREFDTRIYELKKAISVLEWDLPNIRNNQLKEIKEKQLMQYKGELQELLVKNGGRVEVIN